MQDLFVTKKFEDVGSQEDVWDYALAKEDGLLSGFYWNKKYNDEEIALKDRGYIYYENKLLGAPRIRQLRVKEGSCEVHEHFKGVINHCYAPWSPDQEDKQNLTYPEGTGKPEAGQFWMKYQTEEDLGSRPTYGKLMSAVGGNPYGGGGYVQDLPRIDQNASERILNKLKDNLWIGRGTRAVMIDFTVYNANVNLCCIIKLIFEFPASGGCFPHYNFQTLKLIRYVTKMDHFVQICEIIYCIFILYYIIEELFEIHKHKVKYFFEMYNILDVIVIVLSIAGMGFNIYRTLTVGDIIQDPIQQYLTLSQ
jgi:hypothetical protein